MLFLLHHRRERSSWGFRAIVAIVTTGSLAQRMVEIREVITIPDDDEDAQQARTDRNQKKGKINIYLYPIVGFGMWDQREPTKWQQYYCWQQKGNYTIGSEQEKQIGAATFRLRAPPSGDEGEMPHRQDPYPSSELMNLTCHSFVELCMPQRIH